MILSCLTCFEGMSGSKIDYLGQPTVNVLICFTCFEKMPGNKIDFLGVSTYNMSIAFYMLWEEAE